MASGIPEGHGSFVYGRLWTGSTYFVECQCGWRRQFVVLKRTAAVLKRKHDQHTKDQVAARQAQKHYRGHLIGLPS